MGLHIFARRDYSGAFIVERIPTPSWDSGISGTSLDLFLSTPFNLCHLSMEQNSCPQPPPSTWNKYHVRDTLPVYPPTPGTFDSMPILPSPPRKPAFDAPFTLSTHLFPAVYLRTTRPTPLPSPPAAEATKEERRQVLAETALQLLDWGNDTSAVTDGYPLVLWNCVNRYVKNDLDMSNKTGVTLFLAHANGFPKEVSYMKYFWILREEEGYIEPFCVGIRFGNRRSVVYFVHLLLE